MSGEYQLVAVHSERLETAATFALGIRISNFNQLEDFLGSSFDVVYIASPNSCILFTKVAFVCLQACHLKKPAVTQP